MSKSMAIFLMVVLCWYGAVTVSAQNVNPAGVGATPRSSNFDVFPDSTTYDEGWKVLDTDGLGADPVSGREEFIVWAMDENSGGQDAGCGPIKTVVSRNGIEIPKQGAYVADDGYDFFQQAAILGSAEGASGFGFFCGVGADEQTGQFIGSHIIYGMDQIVSSILQPGAHPFANFSYINNAGRGADDFALFQRFDRNCVKVSNMTYGRNVPSPHHESPTVPLGWPTASANSRTGGCDILSDGNTVYVIADRANQGGVGPADHYGLNGATCQLFTITDAAASTYVVSTTNVYRRSDNTTLENDNSQGTAAGQGFWVNHVDADGGSVAVFRNNGTRIGQIFGIGAAYNANPAQLLGAAGRSVDGSGGKQCAASEDKFYIPARYQDSATPGVDRPCILRFKVDIAQGTITPLSALLVDDDFASLPTVSVSVGEMGIAAGSDDTVAIAWRNRNDAARPPVARVYQGDTPLTGSFYVSSLDPINETGYDSFFVKVGLSGPDVLVVWESSNGISQMGVDCYNISKPVATLGRVFEVQKAAMVTNWDLY